MTTSYIEESFHVTEENPVQAVESRTVQFEVHDFDTVVLIDGDEYGELAITTEPTIEVALIEHVAPEPVVVITDEVFVLEEAIGPQGPVGGQGPVGNKGLTGNQGPVGFQGPQGAAGIGGSDLVVIGDNNTEIPGVPDGAITLPDPAITSKWRSYREPIELITNVRVRFTCPEPFVPGTLNVTLNGLLEPVIEVSTTMFDFYDPPLTGDVIYLRYRVV